MLTGSLPASGKCCTLARVSHGSVKTRVLGKRVALKPSPRIVLRFHQRHALESASYGDGLTEVVEPQKPTWVHSRSSGTRAQSEQHLSLALVTPMNRFNQYTQSKVVLLIASLQPGGCGGDGDPVAEGLVQGHRTWQLTADRPFMPDKWYSSTCESSSSLEPWLGYKYLGCHPDAGAPIS